MKSTPRTRKLGEAVREALSEVLANDVQDPRLEFVTVTGVQVSSDLRVADVYVTTHGGPERYTALLEGLRSADKRIRGGLGRRVSMRFIPELRYHLDTSVDEGMRIYEALKHVPESMARPASVEASDESSGESDVAAPSADADRTLGVREDKDDDQ